MDRDNGNWRKASYSNGQGNCVEVADTARVVLVRDTTDRDGAMLSVPAQAWQDFLTRVR
jgi:Domain of unknown function (DUF397)